jgi:hypothetical protein
MGIQESIVYVKVSTMYAKGYTMYPNHLQESSTYAHPPLYTVIPVY